MTAIAHVLQLEWQDDDNARLQIAKMFIEYHKKLRDKVPNMMEPNDLTQIIYRLTPQRLLQLQQFGMPTSLECCLCSMTHQNRGPVNCQDGYGYCRVCAQVFHTGCGLDARRAKTNQKCPCCEELLNLSLLPLVMALFPLGLWRFVIVGQKLSTHHRQKVTVKSLRTKIILTPMFLKTMNGGVTTLKGSEKRFCPLPSITNRSYCHSLRL
jgi:hypothetical protein